MTDAGRAARERVRLEAASRFERGETAGQIAAALRVSERSVERWRRAWREGGSAGVLSKGSPGRSRLSDEQIACLERELERGPLAHGWEDQRWTLARITTLIGRLFHVSYTAHYATTDPDEVGPAPTPAPSSPLPDASTTTTIRPGASPPEPRPACQRSPTPGTTPGTPRTA